MGGGYGVDITPLVKLGVPGADLVVDRTKYFWYHHTDADTMDVLQPLDMSKCAASMAVLSYCVANEDQALPK